VTVTWHLLLLALAGGSLPAHCSPVDCSTRGFRGPTWAPAASCSSSETPYRRYQHRAAASGSTFLQLPLRSRCRGRHMAAWRAAAAAPGAACASSNPAAACAAPALWQLDWTAEPWALQRSCSSRCISSSSSRWVSWRLAQVSIQLIHLASNSCGSHCLLPQQQWLLLLVVGQVLLVGCL